MTPARRLSAARSVRRFSWAGLTRSEKRTRKRGLALGELEAGAGAALSVLLALRLGGIARHVAGLLEDGPERGADQHQGAGHAVADGLRLRGQAAATDVGEDVVAADGLRGLERLAQHHLARRATEVVVDVA